MGEPTVVKKRNQRTNATFQLTLVNDVSFWGSFVSHHWNQSGTRWTRRPPCETQL